MRKYSDLEYLKLNKLKRFFYKVACFFVGIPRWFLNLFKKIWGLIKRFGLRVKDEAVDIVTTFIYGDWKTKLSFLVMGFGNLARGQILRGVLFFLFEAIFIVYMALYGWYWLSKLFNGTSYIGTEGPEQHIYDPDTDQYITITHDNSFKILLYSVLTIFFIIAFIYTWRLNVKQNKISEEIIGSSEKNRLNSERKKALRGVTDTLQREEINNKYNQLIEEVPSKPLKSSKQDLKSLVDDQFHKTLLALPVIGILVFTVMPIIFMILVAFTNYSGANDGVNNNLFGWVGLDNFNTMLSWNNSSGTSYSAAFGEILAWTLIWAFLATFTNYFLGMFVAIMINKKGIKLKKMWRTILVLTIAIPQFISLLYVSKMFADNGFIVSFLRDTLHIVDAKFSFLGEFADPWVARMTIVIINIWIGIPYLMLIATGILMNIPADLYESAQIDGANVWQQYTRITLPYMIFVTGPYLLTSFIGNMNNFNVIYLLTGGGGPKITGAAIPGSPAYTDLLVTWLFKLTTGDGSNYNMASVIGILVFVVVSVISLIVYNVLPSTKNEEDFQ